MNHSGEDRFDLPTGQEAARHLRNSQVFFTRKTAWGRNSGETPFFLHQERGNEHRRSKSIQSMDNLSGKGDRNRKIEICLSSKEVSFPNAQYLQNISSRMKCFLFICAFAIASVIGPGCKDVQAATFDQARTERRSSMGDSMQDLEKWLDQVSGYVWGVPTLILLVGTGILLTVRLRGLQFSKLWYALSLAFGKRQDNDSDGDINHFQALMTALAATIGMGNIAGVATAVAVGGPGAIFWMWITALFGMATKYAEAILAVKYRVQGSDGEFSGGPMYYLEFGLKQKWLAVLFALFGTIASFGIGNMVQSNSVAEAVQLNFSIPPIVTGIALAAFTAFVVLGGVKKIGQVTGIMVPFMALFYILAGIIIVFVNMDQVPEAVATIFSGAFSGTAASGGFLGATVAMAIQKGVARGVFSNEAGLGSAPIAAAAAKTDVPAKQALVSMTGTFIDTIIVCSITGLALVTTGAWKTGKSGVEATSIAFESVFGGLGSIILAISVILFAYSTILGWAYYGEKCFAYLAGKSSVRYYRYIWVVMVIVGATMKLNLAWTLSDIFNGLMAIPNLIGLIGLSGVVVAETNSFLKTLGKKNEQKQLAG